MTSIFISKEKWGDVCSSARVATDNDATVIASIMYIAICDYFLFLETRKITKRFLSLTTVFTNRRVVQIARLTRHVSNRCLRLVPRVSFVSRRKSESNRMNLREARSRKKQFLSRYMHKTGLIQRAFISLGERAVAVFRRESARRTACFAEGKIRPARNKADDKNCARK